LLIAKLLLLRPALSIGQYGSSTINRSCVPAFRRSNEPPILYLLPQGTIGFPYVTLRKPKLRICKSSRRSIRAASKKAPRIRIAALRYICYSASGAGKIASCLRPALRSSIYVASGRLGNLPCNYLGIFKVAD
jgi:hypothetical protein